MTVLPPAITPPDGGWGWVVMVISFVDAICFGGVLKSGGVLYRAIINELPISRTQVALIVSIPLSISCLLGPLSSSLSSRFTHRVVIFTGVMLSSLGAGMAASFPSLSGMIVCYGAIMGFGLGLALLPNIIIVHQYFHRHRTFASAFAMAGGSIGGFAIPPLIEWVSNKYGLFEALLTISAIFLQLSPLTLLIRPVEIATNRKKPVSTLEVNGNKQDSVEKIKENDDVVNKTHEDIETDPFLKEKSSLKTSYESIEKVPCQQRMLQRFLAITSLDPSIFKEKYFYMVCFSSVAFTYAWIGYLTILPDYAATEGSEFIADPMAVLLLSFMSIGDLVFRIIGGWLMDRKWVNRRYAYPFFMMDCAILMLGYAFPQSYVEHVVSSVLVGICVSGVVILPAVLLNDLIGIQRFPMAFSISASLSGCVIFFSAPSLAYLREVAGSYRPCLLLMALCMFMASLCWIIDGIYVYFKKASTPNPKMVEANGNGV